VGLCGVGRVASRQHVVRLEETHGKRERERGRGRAQPVANSPQRGEYGDAECLSVGKQARDTRLSCKFKTALGDEALYLEAAEVSIRFLRHFYCFLRARRCSRGRRARAGGEDGKQLDAQRPRVYNRAEWDNRPFLCPRR
jgi:hypothetical protein